MNQDSAIKGINPISDDAAAGLLSDGTHRNLIEQIVVAPPADRAPRRLPRRLLVGIPVAAGIAAAAVIATTLGHPGTKLGPVAVGPAQANALTFTKVGRYINVYVKDPLADPKRYRAEFKAHGMNITLTLVPASPSIVGTVVEFDGAHMTPITAKGRCQTGGGGACPVGMRVPIGDRERANITFGRAARPGEQYESTASATAPGEALQGLTVRGRTVAAVLAMLAKRHVTVPQYRVASTQAPQPSGSLQGTGQPPSPRSIPGNWYVQDADPWALNQVLLFVGPSRP